MAGLQSGKMKLYARCAQLDNGVLTKRREGGKLSRANVAEIQTRVYFQVFFNHLM